MKFPYTLLVSSDFLFFHDSTVVGASSKGQGQLQLTGSCRGSACWHGHWWVENFLMGTHRAVETSAGSQAGTLGMLWNTTCNQHQEKEVCEDTGGALILCHLKHTCNILSSKKQKTYWQWCFCILRDHLWGQAETRKCLFFLVTSWTETERCLGQETAFYPSSPTPPFFFLFPVPWVHMSGAIFSKEILY